MSDNKKPSLLRRMQIAIVDFSLTVVGLLAIGAGAYYVYKDNPAMVATSMGSGLALLFAATIDRFESLKWLSLEAKTRKLDVTIGNAEIALVQMKKLTEIAGAALISLTSKFGRMGGPATFDDSYTLAKDIRSMLSSVGSDKLVIKNALKPWMQMNSTLLTMHQVMPIQHALIETIANLNKRISEIDLTDREMLVEHGSLIARRNITQSFLNEINESFANLHQWDFNRVKEKLGSIIIEAPELNTETKEKLLSDLSPAFAQIEYLNAELDFKDPEFWKLNVTQ